MGKDTKTIDEQLNRDFNSLCEWFIDNKLSIHFGEEKTKSILVKTKGHLENQTDLNIKYGDIKIKQYNSTVRTRHQETRLLTSGSPVSL